MIEKLKKEDKEKDVVEYILQNKKMLLKTIATSSGNTP